MTAQYRASSLEQGRSAESETQSQAAFSNFIGSGQAYTPQ
jgi:conjugal transfer/entry exclusion protein